MTEQCDRALVQVHKDIRVNRRLSKIWCLVLKADALVVYIKYNLAGMTHVETFDGSASEMNPDNLAKKKDSRNLARSMRVW
jgi:hypothetical protein